MAEQVQVWKAKDGSYHETKAAADRKDLEVMISRHAKNPDNAPYYSHSDSIYTAVQNLAKNWDAFLIDALGITPPPPPPPDKKR